MSRSAFRVGIRNARTGRAMAALGLLPKGASPHCFTCPARGVLSGAYQIMGKFASDQIGFEAAQPMKAAWKVRGSNLFHQGVGGSPMFGSGHLRRPTTSKVGSSRTAGSGNQRRVSTSFLLFRLSERLLASLDWFASPRASCAGERHDRSRVTRCVCSRTRGVPRRIASWREPRTFVFRINSSAIVPWIEKSWHVRLRR